MLLKRKSMDKRVGTRLPQAKCMDSQNALLGVLYRIFKRKKLGQFKDTYIL
jgi:hypothetical protein